MAIYENLKDFFRKPVRDFSASGDVKDFSAVAPRVRSDYDKPGLLVDMMAEMLDEPGVDALEALVIGYWDQHGDPSEETPDQVLEVLVSRKDSLPNLKALFVGDIIAEENEISWIQQGDMSVLWGAFPKLERFVARGAGGLRLGRINHAALNTLVIQSGGLPQPVVQEALAANAPLTHLELWLGDENYGANTGVADFEALFSGALFPELRSLGLRNSEYADDLAEALAEAPLLERLEVLDLSFGTLSDRGAKALAASERTKSLQRLDISHHYVSNEAIEALMRATMVVADDRQKPDRWDDQDHYYVAVSE